MPIVEMISDMHHRRALAGGVQRGAMTAYRERI